MADHEPLLTPDERAAMKRYFLAARQWDKQRRDRLRAEPNDPAANARLLDVLIEHALAVHGGPLLDDEKEDAAEVRLARTLSQ